MTRRIFCKVLLVIVAVFGLLVLSGVLSAQGRSEEALEHAKDVQEQHTDALMAKPGVVGTAVGLGDDGGYAVLVLLERPGVVGIPRGLDGVPVQVVVTGKIYALTMGRYDRPVPIGVSTGHPDITAGTIGCRVKAGNNVYALSNNHVYANSNEATIGDNVLQPGTADGGVDPDDAIGTLFDFEPIVFHPRANNTIDAAIASTTVDLVDNATPAGGYGTPSSTDVEAFPGQQVQKFGRTTGLTTGQVTGINATVRVGYGSGPARFVDQIIVESGTRFIGGGDSGSLLVTDDADLNNPVGLLFAGTSDGLMAVANRIDLVLQRFGVTVDDSEGPVDNPPVADFMGSPTSGDAPLTVNFTDLSTGEPTSWSWVFGDGVGTSTAQNPSYTYDTAGTYTVTLTATNAYGSDLETKVDYIAVTEQTGNPPTADFSASPISGQVPLTVDFTDLSTGEPTDWSWDFGDSVGTSTAQNPSYTYETPGTYTVTLTATNAYGSDLETKFDYITVTEQTGNPPTADFSASPISGQVPLTVDFTDLSTGEPTDWSWDFGDDVGTSTAQNPSYTYDTPGTYTVSLTATNVVGSDTLTKTDYITVTTPLEEPTTVSVILPSGIDGYATEGGRDGTKHLLITVALVDDLGDPVAGASVSIDLFLGESLSPYTSGTGTTGTDGTVTFKVANAPSGTYTTTVTNVVTAEGLTWDGLTLDNEYDKP